MLDIHRGKDIDPRREDIQNVLVALFMRTAGDIGVRQLIHHYPLRVTGDHGGGVHLFERRSPVLHRLAWDDFQIPDLCLSAFASVGHDEPDHDILAALTFTPVRLGQHFIGLAYSGGEAEKELEATPPRFTLFALDTG